MIIKALERFVLVIALGVAVPVLALIWVSSLPELFDYLLPTYSLYQPPSIVRSGMHLIFTLPIRKNWSCDEKSPPYAVFPFVDSKNRSHRVAFDLRGPDNMPLSGHQLLGTGEKSALGPFIVTTIRDVSTFGTGFFVYVPCHRGMVGPSLTRLGPFPLPEDAHTDGAK